jgi:hypothetical protein
LISDSRHPLNFGNGGNVYPAVSWIYFKRNTFAAMFLLNLVKMSHHKVPENSGADFQKAFPSLELSPYHSFGQAEGFAFSYPFDFRS